MGSRSPVPAVAVLLLAVAPAASAQPVAWSIPDLNPMRFTDLPFDPGQGEAAPPGGWRLTGSLGYFNLSAGSWHTSTIHQELDQAGKPITAEELRTLEARHPQDEIYRLDVEGLAGEIKATRGLGRGLAVTVSLPFLELGRPHWDAISHGIHRAFDWEEGSRAVLARGQTLLYAWSPGRGRVLERWQELDGSGVGDLAMSLSGPLADWGGGEHRWALALQAPTGDRDTLRGSGGWDAGVRWVASWRRRATLWRVAAGYSRLDTAGSFLGVERADTWHAQADLHRNWGSRGAWLLSVRWDTSPLAGLAGDEVGAPAFFFTLGTRYELGQSSWVAVALGENLVARGLAPDFTLAFQVGTGR